MHSFYGTRLSENMAKTPEGYLICYDVHIARIGSQDYLGSELGVDDEVVKVDRPATEVFKKSTIASFEGKPFTNDHPYELLDASNTAIYEKGHLQNVRVSDDNIYLDADIMVKDAQTIQDIENGKREVSAGYNCDCIQDENGNWYQCNIVGNHVALVDKGRAGEKVRINDAEWNEADHPRAENGQFGKGGGGSNKRKQQEKSASNPKSGNGGASPETILDKPIEERDKIHEISSSELDKVCKNVSNAYDKEYNSKNIVKDIGFLLERGVASRGDLEGYVVGEELDDGYWQNLVNAFEKSGLAKYQENGDMLIPLINNKEKSMKDKKSVLGRLFKAFTKDAEPEEIEEVINAVKGKDEEPDRLAKLETMVQDLCSRMDAYDEATKTNEPETTALDEVEKELVDEEPDEENKDVQDEDANNDPKLIEALGENAQNDEDTTEEIKKEIADAKKVIARIEDKETRLAVADSLAKVIRGKIKSNDNYKKLMDASKTMPAGKTQNIDYDAVYKKIKEEKFRK